MREATPATIINVKPTPEPHFTAANSNVWLGCSSAPMVPLSISNPAKDAELNRIFG
jgi:hypothetical protein